MFASMPTRTRYDLSFARVTLAGGIAGVLLAAINVFVVVAVNRPDLIWDLRPALPPWTPPAPASETAGLPLSEVQFRIDAARDGDTIRLPEGKYLGGMNFSGKRRITVEAEKPGRVYLEGSPVFGGEGITLRGLVIQRVVTPLQAGALVTGSDWVVEDCVVQDNESLGVSCSGPRSVLRRVKALRNGYMGFGCGSPDGKPFEGPRLYDCESAYNNTGRVDPVWKQSEQAVNRDGLWYINPAWEAGGGKFCGADGLIIEGMKAHHNGGVGIWLDVYNKSVTITDCESYTNFGINAGWEGAGFAVEICDGPTRFENCYAHDNTGSGFAVWESRNVTIRNCVAAGAGIELRDLEDRVKVGWFCQDVIIDSVHFHGPAAKVSYWRNQNAVVRERNRLVERNIRLNLHGTPDWSRSRASATTRTSP